MAALNRLEDGSCQITITISWTDIKDAYESKIEEMVKKADIDGFRQGKAPRKIVEEKLDKSKVYEEVIRTIIPKSYDQAVKDLEIRPVMLPKITLKDAQENKDWTVIALTCEKPQLTLGDYKKALHDLISTKQKKIWITGQEKDEKEEKNTKPNLDEIFNTLLSAINIKLPDIIIEEEVNRMLSDLIDQTKKLGLTVEQYLSSTNRTADSIRAEYKEQAAKTLTIEFCLEDIASAENITVSDVDIQKTIDQAKTAAEKDSMSKQKYYLASILRRRKTIDFLTSL